MLNPCTVCSLAVVFTGDASLRDTLVSVDTVLHIGRRAAAEPSLVIDDRLLSKSHARLERQGEGSCRLVDQKSSNGSFVDGARVAEATVGVGSVIRLGVSLLLPTPRTQWQPVVNHHTAEHGAESLVGNSWSLSQLMNGIDGCAAATEPVFNVGELGTGRRAVAQLIHERRRQSGRLCTLSSASPIEPVLASLRPGDSLYLPEVDRLTADKQSVLARHELSGVSVMASATAELDELRILRGLSPELESRLSGRNLLVPSLRERRADIFYLANAYLQHFRPEQNYEWSASFLEKLLLYDWPLNCRELRVVMREVARYNEPVLRSVHLPVEVRRHAGHSTESRLQASAIAISAAPAEHELRALLEKYDGDLAEVATHYGRKVATVQTWLERHDIQSSSDAESGESE